MACKSKNLPIKYWQEVLPDVLHSIRSLLCTATNETPHECLFWFARRSTSGSAVPTWLATPGPVLLKRHVRTSKTEPLDDEVELLRANINYAHIQLPWWPNNNSVHQTSGTMWWTFGQFIALDFHTIRRFTPRSKTEWPTYVSSPIYRVECSACPCTIVDWTRANHCFPGHSWPRKTPAMIKPHQLPTWLFPASQQPLLVCSEGRGECSECGNLDFELYTPSLFI